MDPATAMRMFSGLSNAPPPTPKQCRRQQSLRVNMVFSHLGGQKAKRCTPATCSLCSQPTAAAAAPEPAAAGSVTYDAQRFLDTETFPVRNPYAGTGRRVDTFG